MRLTSLAFLSLLSLPAAAAAPASVSIFAVELGAPFSVRPCAILERPAFSVSGMCYNGGADAAQGRPSPGEYRVIPVYFGADGTPPISAINSFDVGVQDGTVQEVRIRTNGYSTQDEVMKQLRGMFGAPVSARYETLEQSPSFNSFNVDSMIANWVLGDVVVHYVGIDGALERGTIAILTPTGAAHRFPPKSTDGKP